MIAVTVWVTGLHVGDVSPWLIALLPATDCVLQCCRAPFFALQNSNERRVFNGIEFYLPQLAHMIVHLDVHLPSSALEQFALVVCQQRYV